MTRQRERPREKDGRNVRTAPLLAVLLAGLLSGTSPPARAQLLEGTARWDFSLVRDYFKETYEIDLPENPPAYPNRGLLGPLNPEFALRVDALMAVSRALGCADTGLLAPEGGLRTLAMQNRIWRRGRRLRMNPVTGAPLGDGSAAGHYERMPRQTTVPGAVFNRNRRNARFLVGRRLRWNPDTGRPLGDGSRAEHFEPFPGGDDGQVRTGAFGPSGWHAYGLAADAAWHPGGRYDNSTNTITVNGRQIELPDPASPLHGALWHRTAETAGDLGLCPGIWWQEVDIAHFEWHPRRAGADHRPADPPGLPAGAAAGTALRAEQINAGYAWKIPPTIYAYDYDTAPQTNKTLRVYDLVEHEGWIALKKMRAIEMEWHGAWNAHWITADRPIKLFPAWIPAIHLLRSAEDERWREKRTVTIDSYFFNPIGSVRGDRREHKGEFHYGLSLRVQDLQKVADLKFWRRDPGRQEWAGLQAHSVYDIESRVESVNGDGSLNDTVYRGRRVDKDRFTEDFGGSLDGMAAPGLGLRLGWSRDDGKIGLEVRSVAEGGRRVRKLVDRTDAGDGGSRVTLVTDRLPQGAFDVPAPEPWPAKNPKPAAGTREWDAFTP